MREHVQTTGVRKYAGDDLIELQAEPLAAIQGFFEAYGNCIVQGCEVVVAGNAYDVTTGLLALSGIDADGEATFKVVPFSGVENVTLPLYFTLSHSVVERAYADGKVKPIAYDYRAAVSAVKPADGVSFLELTATGGRRFVDAVKITEKLDKVGNGKDVTVTFSQSVNRENIASGERLGGLFGKVVKWFSDLKALAFKDKVGRGDLEGSLLTEIDGKIEKADSGDAIKLYKTTPANYAYAKRKELSVNVSSLVLGATYGFNTPVDALEINNGEVNALNQLKVGGKPVATTDLIPTTLPANGGNADTASNINNDGTVNLANFTTNNGITIVQPTDFSSEKPVKLLNFHWYSDIWSISNIRSGSVKSSGLGIFFNQQEIYRFNENGRMASKAGTFALTSEIPATLPANGGNADTLDGLHAAGSAVVPNHLASYFGDGSIHASYLYPENGVDDSQTIDNIGIRNGGDAFLRFCSLERFKQALGTFITNRGSFSFDELNTFTNRESGTYSVLLPGAVHSLIVFKSTGSTSAVEILSDYEEDARLQVRKTIDSNRQTNFKELAWLTDIPTSLPANGGNADTLDGHRYNQFIHVVADRSIHADNTDGSFCGFGYDSNGFPTNGSFISFGGLGNEGKYVTQIQAGYINGNEIYFRTRTDDTTPGTNHPWKRIALSDEIPTTTDQISDTPARRYVTEYEKSLWNSKASAIHAHAEYALTNHSHSGYAPTNHAHAMTTVLSAMYAFPWNPDTTNVKNICESGGWIIASVTREGVGQFKVYHNLKNKNYTVLLTGGARATDGAAIISVSLVARESTYFTVQTSVGDQFRDGGFYATILTF